MGRSLTLFPQLVKLLGWRQTVLLYLRRFTSFEGCLFLRVKGLRHRLLCRPTDSDIFCLCDIFSGGDANVDLDPPPAVIIDGGANVGYASVFFANKYPSAFILSIEPDDGNCSVAERNLLHYNNVRFVRGAVLEMDGQVEIANPGDPSAALRVRSVTGNRTDGIWGMSLDSLVKQFGLDWPDVIKLDIEGYEKKIFEHELPDCIANCRALIIEAHGEESRQTVLGKMLALNYTLKEGKDKLCFLRT